MNNPNSSQGLRLLVLSLVAGAVLFFSFMQYAFGLGCGFDHSFLRCTTIPLMIIAYFVLNIAVLLLAIIQIIKPFLRKKVFAVAFAVYLVAAVGTFALDQLIVKTIQGTELECSLIGHYNERDSAYCYFQFAKTKNNISYCDQAGEWGDICRRDIEYRIAFDANDYDLCPDDGCIGMLARKNLDIEGCNLIKLLGPKSSCINYVEGRIE